MKEKKSLQQIKNFEIKIKFQRHKTLNFHVKINFYKNDKKQNKNYVDQILIELFLNKI